MLRLATYVHLVGLLAYFVKDRQKEELCKQLLQKLKDNEVDTNLVQVLDQLKNVIARELEKHSDSDKIPGSESDQQGEENDEKEEEGGAEVIMGMQ